MSNTKNCHFIHQGYLKRFARKNSETSFSLLVYDKYNKKFLKNYRNPKNLANVKNFYISHPGSAAHDQFEEYFSLIEQIIDNKIKVIETEYSGKINCIHVENSINENPYFDLFIGEIISCFAMFQEWRKPENIENIKNIFKTISFANNDLLSAEESKFYALNSMILNKDLATWFYGKNFRIYPIPEDDSLFLSDNPVIWLNLSEKSTTPQNFSKQCDSMVMPLSRKLFVFFSSPKIEIDNSIGFHKFHSDIGNINLWTIENSERYIYLHPEDEVYFNDLINKTNPDVSFPQTFPKIKISNLEIEPPFSIGRENIYINEKIIKNIFKIKEETLVKNFLRSLYLESGGKEIESSYIYMTENFPKFKNCPTKSNQLKSITNLQIIDFLEKINKKSESLYEYLNWMNKQSRFFNITGKIIKGEIELSELGVSDEDFEDFEIAPGEFVRNLSLDKVSGKILEKY